MRIEHLLEAASDYSEFRVDDGDLLKADVPWGTIIVSDSKCVVAIFESFGGDYRPWAANTEKGKFTFWGRVFNEMSEAMKVAHAFSSIKQKPTAQWMTRAGFDIQTPK